METNDALSVDDVLKLVHEINMYIELNKPNKEFLATYRSKAKNLSNAIKAQGKKKKPREANFPRKIMLETNARKIFVELTEWFLTQSTHSAMLE